MYDLTNFHLSQMAHCGGALRALSHGARSVEEIAGRIVRTLHDGFVDPQTGERQLVLARFFKTVPYRDLPPDLREGARRALGEEIPRPDLQSLVLVASAGERPEWNGRQGSRRHQAIPLSTPSLIQSFPMVAQLIRQCGFDLAALMRPDPSLLVDLEQRTYNVFHVAEAPGSRYIPDQEEFVIPYGVHSVIGFGGLLPGGSLFAVILFSRVPIGRESASLFGPLALSAKVAVLPFAWGPDFGPVAGRNDSDNPHGRQHCG